MHGHADCDRAALRAPRLLTRPLGWAADPLLRCGLRVPAFAAVALVLVAFSGAAAFLLLQLAAATLLPAPLVVLAALGGSALATAARLGGAALLLTTPFWITASILEQGRR